MPGSVVGRVALAVGNISGILVGVSHGLADGSVNVHELREVAAFGDLGGDSVGADAATIVGNVSVAAHHALAVWVG